MQKIKKSLKILNLTPYPLLVATIHYYCPSSCCCSHFIFYFYSWTQIQYFLSTFSLYLGFFKLVATIHYYCPSSCCCSHFIFYFYSWTQIQYFFIHFFSLSRIFQVRFFNFFHSLLDFWCNLIINIHFYIYIYI